MDPDRSEDTEAQPGWRAGLSRRTFLQRGTFTAAAVAVASSVPGVSSLVASTAADAPAVDTGISDAADEAGPLTEPLVAHVKDLSTGEISLFQGENEVVVKSPALARGLMTAARR
ncbi:MAG TPA: hypothetical protein VGF51_04845 [Acidimicrobiales bacterium]|jgi:hypothetical protein